MCSYIVLLLLPHDRLFIWVNKPLIFSSASTHVSHMPSAKFPRAGSVKVHFFIILQAFREFSTDSPAISSYLLSFSPSLSLSLFHTHTHTHTHTAPSYQARIFSISFISPFLHPSKKVACFNVVCAFRKCARYQSITSKQNGRCYAQNGCIANVLPLIFFLPSNRHININTFEFIIRGFKCVM